MGRAGSAAGFAFGGDGARKLSKGPGNKAWIVSP